MLRLILFVIYFLRCTVLSVDNYDDWSLDNKNLFPSIPIAAPWSKDEQCRKDSRLLMDNLKNKTYWAMQMWDASGKAEHGILYGNVYQLGNFDECMLVKEPIESQFCAISMRAFVNISDKGDPYDLEPKPNSIVWKKFHDSRIDPSKYPRDNFTVFICAPASCSWKELNESTNRHLQILNSKAGPNDPKYIGSLTHEFHCTKQRTNPFSWSEIFLWSTLGFLVAIQIFVAFFDFERHRDKSKEPKAKKLLMAFSFRRNFNYLFKMESDETQLKQLQILHVVKFLSISFIVFDHRGALTFSSPISNYQKYEHLTRSPENLFALHGEFLADTFLFVGGLLSCYLLLEVYKKKFVNPLIIIFGRWIRLAPLYYLMVWFHADGLLRLGSGPIWLGGLFFEAEKCRKNWWASLFFLNNYVDVDESCMIHSWYIPCDFHMFIIGIFIVIAIIKNEKWGVGLLGFLTFISILIPGIITYIYRLQPIILFYDDFFSNIRGGATWQMLYVPTHTRATVYLLGMIMGYIIFKTKTYKKKLPSFYGSGLMILCLGLLFAPMAYGGLYYDPRKPYDAIESAIFSSVRRLSWGLGCFVCMIVNCFGRNYFLRTACKKKFYLFMSKLTYSIYLIHFYMQYADVVRIRTPGYFSIYDTVIVGCGDLMLSVLYGATFYLLVELPFKVFFHELLFSKEIKKIKTDIENEGNPLQMDAINNLDSNNFMTVKL